MRRCSLLLLCCCHFAHGADVTPERITALAKTYFRDSAEVPMNVAVTTVVTDKAGKVKHQRQSIVRMVFHGYNLESGKFSLRANSGWFNVGALRDSVGGDLAAFISGGYLVPARGETRPLEIQRPSEPGKPIIVVVKDEQCPQLELTPRWLFLKKPCGTAQFTMTTGVNGELAFDHFNFDSSGHAAPGKMAYFGDVQLLSFHAGVDFQSGLLPGDPKPFLWPKKVVTSVTTDKGVVTITNLYGPKK